MRFPLAALFCVIASFIFFIIWAVSSYMLETVAAALLPTANAEATAIIVLIQSAFGIIALLFLIAGIILVFILDATSEEQEIYWREQP